VCLLCCRYRRLTMWLPHGLQAGTSLPSVKAAMRLCCLTDPFGSIEDSCSDQAFWLSRPAPAVLSMQVPALNPGHRCVVRIKDDSQVGGSEPHSAVLATKPLCWPALSVCKALSASNSK
jgi:hypothetical protein